MCLTIVVEPIPTKWATDSDLGGSPRPELVAHFLLSGGSLQSFSVAHFARNTQPGN